MNRFPVLFISHGAPTFALEPGLAGPLLRGLAERLPKPRAVVIVSPHWMTRQPAVSMAPRQETIHDFGGFPAELYGLSYPAAGAPAIAEQVAARLEAAGLPVTRDPQRGLDHGAWVPMMHLYPDADVPVLQVSLPRYRSPADYVALGRALAPLREEGILVIGSGSITHNLYDLHPEDTPPVPYAVAFVEWFASRLAAGDMAALLDYRRQAPNAERAHPTDEHLMPLYVALGAAGDEWRDLKRLEGGMTYGALGMDSYVFAAGAHAAAGREAAPA